MNDIYLSELFHILDQTIHENELIGKVELNANHEIFDGHFPENPILPGVCFIEIIKESITQFLKKDPRLYSCDSIKFLHPINPLEVSSFYVKIYFDIKDKSVFSKAIIYNEDKVFCKFSGVFIDHLC